MPKACIVPLGVEGGKIRGLRWAPRRLGLVSLEMASGLTQSSNFVTYSTTKGAHIALAKSTAVHCAGQGLKVRCNVIHPGVVETDMIKGVIAGAPDSDAARAMFEGMAPMKRMAHVDEIAGLVVYLGSDEAAFISGASYNIDGATTAGMMGV